MAGSNNSNLADQQKTKRLSQKKAKTLTGSWVEQLKSCKTAKTKDSPQKKQQLSPGGWVDQPRSCERIPTWKGTSNRSAGQDPPCANNNFE